MIQIIKFFELLKTLIFNTNFVVKKPTKVNILLYDQGKQFNNILIRTLENKDTKIDVLYTRYEQINLHVVIKIILKYGLVKVAKNFYFIYICEYCRFSKPNILITSNFFDQRYFKLKKILNPKVIICIIQTVPLESRLLKNKKTVDLIFYFDEFSKKIIKKKFNSKLIKIGSIKNNFFLNKNRNKNKNILLISGYKKKFESNINFSNEYNENLYHEKFLVNCLFRLQITDNIKFKILLKPNVDLNDYIKFTNIKKKHIYKNNNNPYNIIDKYNLIITLNNGTMGYEAISRGKKNIQIPLKKYKKISRFYVFEKKLDQENVTKFIKTFNFMSDKKFKFLLKKNSISTLDFDIRNQRLKKTINNILSGKF